MPPKSIAVIGGGITGLAAAHHLWERDPTLQIQLFEASDRLGGVLQTEHRQGYLLEQSADNFITNVPWGLDLCRRIGFDQELIETDASRRRAFVIQNGRLHDVPEGFVLMSPRQLWPVLTSPILSLGGKLRLLGEYFIPPRSSEEDESLASFAIRRFGRQVFERLIQPLVGGIYTADSEKLSMKAALPQFVRMEKQYGSLIRAAYSGGGKEQSPLSKQKDSDKDSDSGARYSLFVAPRDGMSSLIQAISARLPEHCVRLNSPIALIHRSESSTGWRLEFEGEAADENFDGVILCAPAPRAARIVSELDPELRHLLEKIPYAGSAIALVGYRRDQFQHPINGFGFVVPETERRPILAGSFSSNKFPGRSPEGEVLVRVFFGGAQHPEMIELDDQHIRKIVQEQLSELLGIQGEPTLFHVHRWHGAMPQYHVGHLQLTTEINRRAAELPNFEIAGNAFQGVGIPNCIHSGETAADRILGI